MSFNKEINRLRDIALAIWDSWMHSLKQFFKKKSKNWLPLLIATVLSVASSAHAQVFTETFDSGSFSGSWDETLIDTAHYTPNTSETTTVTSPNCGGTRAANYYALTGTDEHTPLQLRYAYSDLDEVWLDWYEYIATGYPDTASQKLARIGWYADGEQADWKELTLQMTDDNTNVNFGWFCGQWGNTTKCNVDTGDASGAGLEYDTCIHFRIHILLNTPGSSDGLIEVTKDGSPYLSVTSANLRGTATTGLNYFWVGGNYSNSGNLTSSGNRYFDEINFYSSDPGSSSSSSSSSSGASPTQIPTTHRDIMKFLVGNNRYGS